MDSRKNNKRISGEQIMVRENGITIISPCYGDIERLMHSIFNQYRGADETWKLEVILANDNVEDENYEHYYDNYIEQAKNFDWIEVKVLNHKEEGHWFQGLGRQKGIEAASYKWVLTIDSDDEYLPYAMTNLMATINQEKERMSKVPEKDRKEIAFIGFDFLSYDKGPYLNHIGRDNPTIWVQSRLYNKDFVLEHRLNKLYDETQVSSKRGEDYPWVNLFDYYLNHEMDKYYNVMLGHEAPPMALWTPNKNSFSRQDPYYGQGLAGYTMGSSIAIYQKMKEYNEAHNISLKEDEHLKHRLLNQTIYAFYNLVDFIWTVGATKNFPVDAGDTRKPYTPKEHHWTLLRDNTKWLRKELLNTYYPEIQDNDIICELEGVLHRSDCRVHNTWDCNFMDFMKKGWKWLNFDYNKMMEEARKLDFDGMNCLQSPKVEAWKNRHNQ